MDTEVRVPDIGDFDEVEIVEVLVSVGATVELDESLVTLESDKASMDIPSPGAGTIKQVAVKVGDMVGEGALIAVIELPEAPAAKEAEPEQKTSPQQPSQDSPSAAPAITETAATKGVAEASASAQATRRVAGSPVEASSSTQATRRVAVAGAGTAPPHASPSIRRFGRELGVDLRQVQGSGRKGRIVREDVTAFVKARMQAPPAAAPASAIPEVPVPDFSKFGEVAAVKLSRIQQRSKANLHRSWLNVPHVTQHDEADITDLEAVRKERKAAAAEAGAKLTLLPYLMKAVVKALVEHPRLRSSLDAAGEGLIQKNYYHLGIAVDTEDGLVVPVIRNVDQKSIVELATELSAASDRARSRKLKMDDLSGSVFTITSLGGIGGTAFTPIVNSPEVGILGVSRSRMQPVWQDGEFIPRLILPLSLSYDHRVVDGVEAVRFTTLLCQILSDAAALDEPIAADGEAEG